MSSIEPFVPPFSASDVEELRGRLGRVRWPQDTGVLPGVDAAFLQDLCAYWAGAFDWERQVAWLREFPHFLYSAGEERIHFIHVRGAGPSPMPLVLTHGWPGSFVEMLELIPLLTDPARFGGDAADAFDVVVPSLPGFGYSSAPRSPGMNAARVADIWADLMTALGYARFGAQGGDLGAAVSTALGLRHEARLTGVHLNYVPGSYRPYLAPGTELSQAEQQFLRDAAQWYDANGAYAHMQGTRGLTAAYALNDSPAGLAAWMVEKFREWSDCGGDVYRSFSRDHLLTNIMLYWTTQTIGPSFGMYAEGRRAPMHFREGERVRVPCGFACFPKEILVPPRSWVERGYNVQRWTEMPRGGHFAAAEEPGLLAAELRAFFRRGSHRG